MTIEPAFRILLTSNPSIVALVGNRVYHNMADQNETRPRIVMQLVSSVRLRRLDGTFGMKRGIMQMTCLASTYEVAKKIAAAVVECADIFRGEASNKQTFALLEVEDETDVPSAPLKGQATPTFGVAVDVRFFTQEQPS